MSASVSEHVRQAVSVGRPVVALETAVLTHGLPRPVGTETVLRQVAAIELEGAVAAVVGLVDGVLRVGLTSEEIRRLGETDGTQKVNLQNLSTACHARWTGGLTVSATMHAANRFDIRVMATGGIGGVHRGCQDVSTDLFALAETPMLVVCSGPKAVLDIPATLERLEANGVPVVGYCTDSVPAFYCTSCGLPVTCRLDSPDEAASLYVEHQSLGLRTAILLVNPPPREVALPWEAVHRAVEEAEEVCVREGVTGRAVTPRLLKAVSSVLRGHNIETNVELLVANARLAGQVASALAG